MINYNWVTSQAQMLNTCFLHYSFLLDHCRLNIFGFGQTSYLKVLRKLWLLLCYLKDKKGKTETNLEINQLYNLHYQGATFKKVAWENMSFEMVKEITGYDTMFACHKPNGESYLEQHKKNLKKCARLGPTFHLAAAGPSFNPFWCLKTKTLLGPTVCTSVETPALSCMKTETNPRRAPRSCSRDRNRGRFTKKEEKKKRKNCATHPPPSEPFMCLAFRRRGGGARGKQ